MGHLFWLFFDNPRLKRLSADSVLVGGDGDSGERTLWVTIITELAADALPDALAAD